jgi:FkbM family methyltransferase
MIGMSDAAPGGPAPQERPSEPLDVALMRTCLNRWPLPRGRGLLMRLFRPWLRHRHFALRVGPEIFIPGDLDDYVVRWSFIHGYERDPYVRVSWDLIPHGGVVLDVGSNIGMWLMGAARKTGPAGSVHAFEPLPGNMERLRRNLALNRIEHVVLNQLAVSNEPGVSQFFPPRGGNSGTGSLARQTSDEQPVDVELTTLDAYCERHRLSSVDFLKVDVEGAEIKVFEGARRLLSSPGAPMILFEASDLLGMSGSSRAIKGCLAAHGYRFFLWEQGRWREIPVEMDHRHVDLLAFRDHHRARSPLVHELLARRR